MFESVNAFRENAAKLAKYQFQQQLEKTGTENSAIASVGSL